MCMPGKSAGARRRAAQAAAAHPQAAPRAAWACRLPAGERGGPDQSVGVEGARPPARRRRRCRRPGPILCPAHLGTRHQLSPGLQHTTGKERANQSPSARPTHSGGTRCRPCSRECHQQPRSQAPAPHRHEALAGSGRTSCERHFKAPIEAAARRGAMGGSSCCCKPQRSAGEVEARNATGLLQSSVSSVSRAGWKEHPTGQLFQLAGWSGGVAPPRGGAALGRTLHPPAGSSAP